jgi:hypothetical protein
MNRCPQLPKALFPVALCACLTPLGALLPAQPAQAQQNVTTGRGRIFPQHVRRGAMQFTDTLQVLLDGNVTQLAPGVRVHNQHNMIVLTNTLIGPQTYVVNYLRDPSGTVREVWLLTPREASTMPDGSPVLGPPEGNLYN